MEAESPIRSESFEINEETDRSAKARAGRVRRKYNIHLNMDKNKKNGDKNTPFFLRKLL